jgi:rhodanese-related sulfurtransferase
MAHTPAFERICTEARARIREVSVAEVRALLDAGEVPFTLVDVREDREFAVDHLPLALHIGRGVLERDIEGRIPDISARVILYCGGGYRSALAADSIARMGYTNVESMAGGIRAWRAAGHPVEVGTGD